LNTFLGECIPSRGALFPFVFKFKSSFFFVKSSAFNFASDLALISDGPASYFAVVLKFGIVVKA
jgi:hypothetical protein